MRFSPLPFSGLITGIGDATSNSAIDNISISPEEIYPTNEEYFLHCVVEWFLGMRLENKGSNPQLIK
jgi:hypothetical protein